MKLKTTISILLLAIVFVLTACNNSNSDLPVYESTAPNSSQTESASTAEVENTTVAPTTTDPVDISSSESGSDCQVVMQWFDGYTVTPFVCEPVDDFMNSYTAPLVSGGTVTIDEMDGMYFRTLFHTAYSGTTAQESIDFLRIWLGRNLTDVESDAVKAAIRSAQETANAVFVDAAFPEGISVCVVCDASYGCQLSL